VIHPKLQIPGEKSMNSVCAFALASTLLSLMLSLPSYGQVVINEVLYDPPGTDSGCFVELIGIAGFSLDGYFLIGINGEDGKQYCLIDLTDHVIPPDGYFVVAQDGSVPDADLIDSKADFQNGPDSIELWCEDNKIDSVGYGDFSKAVFTGEGEPTLDPPGYSIGRRPDGLDTNNNSIDFVGLAVASPGAPNSPRLAVESRFPRRDVSVWGRIKSDQ
jgi:hypothetical protein